jgi:NAD(P)-dependent dehydrogenase (short-subunit alcohol dehydrogenase family)
MMQTALITGANKGIGFETARQLGTAGYHIFLGARSMASGEAAASKLKEQGVTQVTVILIDISDSHSPAPRIVNVTSGLASLTRHNDPGWKYHSFKGAAYGPSKTALNAYTVSLAHELNGTPFKVNCVDPGYTATDFNNYRGERKPEDAARIIVRFATLGPDGPTGKFYDEDGPAPW